MKLPFTAALSLAVLVTGAWANDADSGTALVPNNHGGYNVVEPSARPPDNGAALINGTALISNNHGGYNVVQPSAHHFTLPFFGNGGYASHVIAQSHEKPKFILRPGVQDDGHGNPHTVYKKIRFATAEEAEAARLKQ